MIVMCEKRETIFKTSTKFNILMKCIVKCKYVKQKEKKVDSYAKI